MTWQPTTAYLFPHGGCNLSCSMCYSRALAADDGEERLSVDEYRRLVGQLFQLGVRTFDCSGGEPLLRQDLFEIIKTIKKLPQVSLWLVSNGTLVEERWSELAANQHLLDLVAISLDADNAAEHDAIRGRPGAFQQAVAAVSRLRSLGQARLAVNTVAMSQEITSLAGLVGLAAELGADELVVQWCRPLPGSPVQAPAEERSWQLWTALEAALERCRQQANGSTPLLRLVLPGELFRPYTAFVAEQPRRRRTWAVPTFCPLSSCRAFGRSIAVSPTGVVTGCMALLGRSDSTALRWRDQVPLQQWQARGAAVQSRLRATLQQRKRQELCRTCAERRLCGGGCPASKGCSRG